MRWKFFLAVVPVLFQHFNGVPGGELQCGPGRMHAMDSYSTAVCNQVQDACTDNEVQMCPPVSRIEIDNSFLVECPINGGRRTLQNTTASQLHLSVQAHSDIQYNLTVSWEHLNLTIPAGHELYLKLFRGLDDLEKWKCSTQEDGTWTKDSFDGLVYGKQYTVVELSAIPPSSSEPILVVSTNFPPVPTRCLDILPVSPYHCLEQTHQFRTTGSVANLSHALIEADDEYRVALSWKPNATLKRYKVPLTYYVKVYNNSNENSQFYTAFNTNQTEISILHLERAQEYFIKVQTFIPCSMDCAKGQLRTILSTPSSAPVIVQVVPNSSTALEVTWTEISESDRNGIILQYEVKYRVTNRSDIQLTRTTTNLSLVLMDLEASTVYEISVRAYTSVGAGNYSEVVSNKTLPNTVSTSADPVIVVAVTIVVVVAIFAVVFILLIVTIWRRMHEKVVIPNLSVLSEEGPLPKSLPIYGMSTKEPDSVSQASSDFTTLVGDLHISNQSENTSQSEVEALIVIPTWHPNKEALLERLNRLSSQKNQEGARIKLIFPGYNGARMSASGFFQQKIHQYKDLPILCVVNEEFSKECFGQKTINSLAFTVFSHAMGKETYTEKLDQFLVLYENQNDLEHVPPKLKQATETCHVDEIEKIARFVFKQPEFVLQQ